MLGNVLSVSECVSVTPPVSRLAVQETVDTKQVGMREKVPEKGEQSTACCFVLANSLPPQSITFPVICCLTIWCFPNTAVLCCVNALFRNAPYLPLCVSIINYLFSMFQSWPSVPLASLVYLTLCVESSCMCKCMRQICALECPANAVSVFMFRKLRRSQRRNQLQLRRSLPHPKVPPEPCGGH